MPCFNSLSLTLEILSIRHYIFNSFEIHTEYKHEQSMAFNIRYTNLKAYGTHVLSFSILSIFEYKKIACSQVKEYLLVVITHWFTIVSIYREHIISR